MSEGPTQPDAFLSDEKRDEHGRFVVPPKSPGRPAGSRNKLGEAFLRDLYAVWETDGIAAIREVRADKPDQFLKVVASTLPKELNIKVGDLDDLTDDELAEQFATAAAQLASGGHAARLGISAPTEGGAGEEETRSFH